MTDGTTWQELETRRAQSCDDALLTQRLTHLTREIAKHEAAGQKLAFSHQEVVREMLFRKLFAELSAAIHAAESPEVEDDHSPQ